jgi:hypothetical protein
MDTEARRDGMAVLSQHSLRIEIAYFLFALESQSGV